MRQPSDAEVLRAAMEAATKTVMTSLPGKVVSYDAATKLATIEPMVHNGNPLPPIPEVPVKFPRGGGYRMVWPLNPGDEVTIHFHKWDPSRFRVSGEKAQSNLVRDTGIYPVAVPGSESETSTYTGAGSNTMHLGRDAGDVEIIIASNAISLKAATVNLTGTAPGDAAALASKVEAALNKLQSAMSQCATAFTAIAPVAPNSGAAGVNGAMAGFDSAVASTKVKIA